MSELSDFLEQTFLEITLKGATAYNVPTPYLALFIDDPTDAGSGTECSWNNYIRQAMSFGEITDGSVSTDAAITFAAIEGAQVTITHVAIFDSEINGNVLYHTPLDVNKTLSVDDIMSMPIGGFTVTIA
tara:strand:- start:1039 stop:1425 length:387 start_codon:yes stop_codon:yes gene_type:complete